MRVAKWNYERDNTNFDMELELNMLAEEAQEFKDGLNDYFDARCPDDAKNSLVEMIDAYCDYKFVAQGTRYKALGLTIDLGLLKSTEDYMFRCLLDVGVSFTLLEEAYELVIEANNLKGTEKVDGKIQKSEDWVDPKEKIKELLYDN